MKERIYYPLLAVLMVLFAQLVMKNGLTNNMNTMFHLKAPMNYTKED